jgi:hypothetical protein
MTPSRRHSLDILKKISITKPDIEGEGGGYDYRMSLFPTTKLFDLRQIPLLKTDLNHSLLFQIQQKVVLSLSVL